MTIYKLKLDFILIQLNYCGMSVEGTRKFHTVAENLNL